MARVPPQPDCYLCGRRVVVHPLRTGDLPEMDHWRLHPNRHLLEHNLSFAAPADRETWLRKRLWSRWAYAIRNLNGILVGHFSLRDMDIPRSTRLGIGLAAQYVGFGYGSDALRTFLDYYFSELGFREMRLDVSSANIRAHQLYLKLGFDQVGSFWRRSPAGVDWGFSDGPNYRKGRVRYIEMRMRARDWGRVQASLG